MCSVTSDGVAGLNLDEGQKFAFDAFRRGKSIALIGGAGSGKSFLLNLLIREAKESRGGYVVPCAFSNKAAEAMNGVTIHNLFAAKPSWEFSREHLVQGVKQKPGVCKILRKLRVLIIDEISLLTSNVMDSIDFVLRELSQSEWHSSLPFGGRQLVAAGDPFQLEPYPDNGCVQIEALQASYESRSWYLTFGPMGDGVIVILKTNHRQRDDNNFFDILSRIRVGNHTPCDIQFLNGLSRGSCRPPNTHTRLCLTNRQTAVINERNLNLLPGAIIRSVAVDKYYSRNKRLLEEKLRKVAPTEVLLKIAARVVLTRKMGEVMPGTHAVIRRLIDFTASSDSVAQTFEVELETVIGTDADGEGSGILSSSREFFRVRRTRYDVHSYDRTVIASREQLPLIPAYAITIHRSQGMTLSHVAVNFEMANNWKPNGMVYVALSRCKTSSGLWVRCLRDEFISVSTKAKNFMKELWDLHVHIPSRIWGVHGIGSLCLIEEDITTRPDSPKHTEMLCRAPSEMRVEDVIIVDDNDYSVPPSSCSDVQEVRCTKTSFQKASSDAGKCKWKPSNLASPISKRRFVFEVTSPNCSRRDRNISNRSSVSRSSINKKIRQRYRSRFG